MRQPKPAIALITSKSKYSGKYYAALRTGYALLFLGYAFLFLGSTASAQAQFSGKITDSRGSPLPGATIVLVGGNKFATADSTGQFSIAAAKGNHIEISHLGYTTLKYVLDDEIFLTIPLTEAPLVLQEVVVRVGYGSTQRKDITGAVAKISQDEFNTGIVTNSLQQIQGKVAGVSITQPGGDPNGDFSVRIRGATSLEGQPPLLVIDGVAIDDFNRYIATLNPADIESYDILKDAFATAIYGSRGANGVILITTKRAKSDKPVIEYNGFVAFEEIANQIDVLNADEWRAATATTGDGGNDKGADKDWQEEISQTGFTQSHTLGIGGGTDQLNLYGSIGYINQQGVILNSGKEMITVRLNAQQKSINDKLEISYGVNASTIHRDFLPDQFSTSQVFEGGSYIFYQALSYLPVVPVYNEDGSYYRDEGPGRANPVQLLKEMYHKKRENFFQGSLKADFELIEGLKVGGLSAVSFGNEVSDYFDPDIFSRIGLLASKVNTNKQTYSGDVHANYRRRFRKHSMDITTVYEYNKFVNDGSGVAASGFEFPDFLNNNLGAATHVTPNDISSFKNEVRIISFLGRAVYNYDDRYIFTTNFRWDGSSKFGPDYRWGFFPSLALAWRLSNEKFLTDVSWLNNLKIRVSYGLTGNQENLLPNSYQLLYGPSGPYLYNGNIFQSYGATQEYNPDLRWEKRKSFNVGMDFSLANSRVNGTIDVFNDETSDMLFNYNLPQPPFVTNEVTANAANGVNRGIEITLNGVIISQQKFMWESAINFSAVRNYITNLSGQFREIDLSITNRHYGYAIGRGLSNAYVSEIAVGYPAGVFWIPRHEGFNEDGKELFIDHNDVTTTKPGDEDRVYIDPTPDFGWGFTNNFKVGNFDLSVFFMGVQGQKIFANSLLDLEARVYLPASNVTPEALTNGFTEQPLPSTYWLRDGSFIRLQNLTLGYNCKNLNGFSQLRFYFAATNLFVITEYDGVDPEISAQGSQRFIDSSYYPKSRGYTLGVKASF